MRKYFLHQLKKNLLPLAIFTLFCIVIYVVPILVENYEYWNSGEHVNLSLYYEYISAALGVMSVLIPIYILSYKMNRRSVDMHYSLPVSKRKILLTNFLVGLILMYASYSIAYLLGFITVVIKVERLRLIYYLYLYLASLFPAFITYAFTAFIFTRANTMIDGIISVAGALCIFALAVSVIDTLWPHFLHGIDGSWFFSFTPLVRVTVIFGKAIKMPEILAVPEVYSSQSLILNRDDYVLVGGIMWSVLAITATALLFITEKNSKAENCGQISGSFFCYKAQIPAYTAMLITLVFSEIFQPYVIALACAVVFAAFVFSVIYKRSIKIGLKFAVAIITSVVVGISVCLINLMGLLFLF